MLSPACSPLTLGPNNTQVSDCPSWRGRWHHHCPPGRVLRPGGYSACPGNPACPWALLLAHPHSGTPGGLVHWLPCCSVESHPPSDPPLLVRCRVGLLIPIPTSLAAPQPLPTFCRSVGGPLGRRACPGVARVAARALGQHTELRRSQGLSRAWST